MRRQEQSVIARSAYSPGSQGEDDVMRLLSWMTALVHRGGRVDLLRLSSYGAKMPFKPSPSHSSGPLPGRELADLRGWPAPVQRPHATAGSGQPSWAGRHPGVRRLAVNTMLHANKPGHCGNSCGGCEETMVGERPPFQPKIPTRLANTTRLRFEQRPRDRLLPATEAGESGRLKDRHERQGHDC